MSWHQDAACIGVDTEVFYDAPNGVYDSAVVDLCRSCPARLACLTEALDYERIGPPGLIYGYRGGMSPAGRARILRKERRNAA